MMKMPIAGCGAAAPADGVTCTWHANRLAATGVDENAPMKSSSKNGNPLKKIYRGIGILPLPYPLVNGPGVIRSLSRYVPLVLHLSGYSVPALC
jgi:hypothetical protein